MRPERWHQVDQLFQVALSLKPVDRAAFLDHACEGDFALRREVESLLASHAHAASFISSPAVAEAAPLLAEDNPDSIVDRSFGPYHVLSLIDAGGMGEVYLAEDTRLRRKVALKLLLPRVFIQDEWRSNRFKQEAQAASALNHPNIITIHDIGQVDDGHFMALEFVEGETLRQRLAESRMSLSQSLDIAVQTASALTAAHQAGIVHRDIKPENIMLRRDGIVKVLDFGLVKLTAGQPFSASASMITGVNTEPGTLMGTANYMSPEQARKLEVDARSDIFSLGVVIYEMLVGRPPFTGNTTADVIASILEKEAVPLSHYSPEAPARLQWILSKALHKEREHRYQTAEELLGDLRSIKEELEFEAKLGRSTRPESNAAAPSRRQAIVKEPGDRTGDLAQVTVTSLEYLITVVRDHKFAFAALALLLLALVGVGLYRLAGLGQVKAIETREISERIRLQLSGREPVTKRHTENPEAYKLYSLGRSHLAKRTPEGLKKGTEYLEQAVSKDPAYALAHAALADAYLLLITYGVVPPRDATEKLRAAALEALKIDETLAEAHVALAALKWRHDNDWAGGEREHRRALELNPNYATAHQRYALLLIALGRFDEALAAIERARNLDPASLIINSNVGEVLYYGRRYEEAIEHLRKTLEIDPNFRQAHIGLALCYTQIKRFPEAVAELQKALSLSRDAVVLADLGYVYAVSGDRAGAQKMLVEVIELSTRSYVSPFEIAMIYVGLENRDAAFEWLNRAYEERSDGLRDLKVDPRMDSLRADPRFQDLLKRTGRTQ